MYHLSGTTAKAAKCTAHFYRSTTKGIAHHWHRHLHLGGFKIPRLVADYYSKYPFGKRKPRGQSNNQTVIKIMKQIFSEQGIPNVVRSDNRPHYNSQAFKAFARDFGFQHVTSSPHYLRSNGFIESQVMSVKTSLLKAKTEDPEMGLRCLTDTPIDHKLPSPA